MKKLMILTAALFISSAPIFAQSKAGKMDTTKHTPLYACPKHPEITGHKPGKCPKCGMQLSLSPKEQMKSSQLTTYRCPSHLEVTSHDPGKCPKCGKKLALSPKEQMKTELAKIYTCPMHPEVALDKEGNCPKCGAALVEKKKS